MAIANKKAARRRRHLRLRKKVIGTPERPRLAVFRSLHHIYAQVIDDFTGHTVVSASTVEPEVRKALKNTDNAEAAAYVGKLVGERALAQGITQVVFDRGGNLYHGRVKALAEGAREAGLAF